MYKANSSVMDYLNPKGTKNKEKNTKDTLKKIWKWVKISGFLFIIISMLWGCVQMYQSDYMVNQVIDMTGSKVYAPGVSFEIIIRSLGEQGGKNHIINSNGSDIFEYGYHTITSWSEAFTVTKSPFYGFFVYPTAFILVGLIKGFSGTLNPGLDDHSQVIYGVSAFFGIFITVIIVRSITLAFTWKSQRNQEKMQTLQLKQAEIQAKYKEKKDMQSRQKQQAETMALYKKEGLSPMSAMTGSFASLPFLFAIYAIIRSTRALKIANIGQISLIEQPWQQLTSGKIIYIVIFLVYLPLQIFSMLLPTLLQYKKQKTASLTEAQRKARKRQLIMQLVMTVVFIFVIASVATGVAIYWIISSTFQICQTLGFHYYNERRAKSGNRERQRRLRQQKNSIVSEQKQMNWFVRTSKTINSKFKDIFSKSKSTDKLEKKDDEDKKQVISTETENKKNIVEPKIKTDSPVVEKDDEKKVIEEIIEKDKNSNETKSAKTNSTKTSNGTKSPNKSKTTNSNKNNNSKKQNIKKVSLSTSKKTKK